jgi:mannan endo-1,4-beta-mannosidase
MRRGIFLIVALIAVLFACNTSSLVKKNGQIALSNSDNKAVLNKYLQSVAGKQVLFGQQDALAYGIGWSYEKDRSDVKSLVGAHPAVLGWDLGNILHDKNLDSVPFAWIRENIIRSADAGLVNSLSWHVFSPVTGSNSWDVTTNVVGEILPGKKFHSNYLVQLDSVVNFLASLRFANGTKVPVILRPFHEMDGSWFWWGNGHCTTEDYKALYRFTVDYLRQHGTDNVLFAYSPDRNFDSAESYLKYFPGDAYVDILGMDDYWDFKQADAIKVVAKKLEIVVQLAKDKGKVAAFSETGSEKMELPDFYTKFLLPAIESSELTRQISYVLVWRNARTDHFYVPYKGHASADDFVKFYNSQTTAFANEVKVPYVK